MAYYSGWRVPSEILPLSWAQVDRSEQTIRLEPGTTKNKKGRTLPYGQLSEVAEAIDRQWAEHKRLRSRGVLCPSVFHRGGKPIIYFRRAWQTACKSAGVPGMIPHDFRRTAVRNLLRAGVPEKISMTITGHKTRSVFDRYDIVDEADLRKAVGMLGDAAGKERRSGRFRLVALPS